jgi:hypothetical protein
LLRMLLFWPCFVPVPSLGFHPSEGFSPTVAPGASRLAVSPLSLAWLAPGRLRGFRHRLDALRPPRMVSADGPRSFPGRLSPSRYRPLLVSLRASASLLSWASLIG